MQLPGAKTAGSSIGFGAAAWLAPEATTVTKHWLGYPVDPKALEDAVTTLVMAGWGGIITCAGLVGALVANYYWRRAQDRWGMEPTREPVLTPVGTGTNPQN